MAEKQGKIAKVDGALDFRAIDDLAAQCPVASPSGMVLLLHDDQGVTRGDGPDPEDGASCRTRPLVKTP